MDEQVVQPDRRDLVLQRLQRHPVVARGELELLDRDAGGHAPTVTCRGMDVEQLFTVAGKAVVVTAARAASAP